MVWAAIASGIACWAQTPPVPPPANTSSGTQVRPQAPPAAGAQSEGQVPPAIAIPDAPFESAPGSARAPGGRGASGAGAAVRTSTGPSGQTASAAEKEDAGKKAYVIGALDVLDVRVWNDPKLSGFLDVRPDGMVSMQLVGEVKADGLTVPQFTEALKQKLSELINEPAVNVQVARFNSKHYYIFGEVGRTGEFPLITQTTVMDALANTGGFREFANLKKIYVLRGSQKLYFNYKDVSHGKHMEQNIVLENGDRIFVP
jgi:polysaccharide export outer membrane protein